MPARRPACAFSLIELLAVIAVIAILAGFVVNSLAGARKRTASARCRTELAVLAAALEDYKRQYGDYPQLGEFGHAVITPANNAAPGLNTAEAKLFNCLTGVFGPKAFTTADQLNGPNFLEGSPLLRMVFVSTSNVLDSTKCSLNGTVANSFLAATPNGSRPPFKTEQNICFVDPFGNRYFYYYKNRTNPNIWQAPGYLLFSVGPDGAHTPPATNTGLYTSTQLTAANNGDNVYANR